MALTHISVTSRDKVHGHDPELSLGIAPAQILFPPSALVYKAVIQVFDQDIVFTDDGSTPTATHGLVVSAGDIWVCEHDLPAMRAIRARAVTGTARLRRAYYGI